MQKIRITAFTILFYLILVACLHPKISPPFALLSGICFAQFGEHPFSKSNATFVNILLKFSVVGLGFGINANTAWHVGKEGFLLTSISLLSVLLLGFLLGKLFKTERKTSFLISAGTAICGGSAIAAISPLLKASEKQISLALGVVFILNALALFIFPLIGHYCHLSQSQFGVWCAIAIHDTSSVVGAASKYGQQALEIATTVKLARALWIIPTAIVVSLVFKGSGQKISIPYFIGLFILAILANAYFPNVHRFSAAITQTAKAGLTLTLFLIGSGLSFQNLKILGLKPFIQGTLLWLFISAAALWSVCYFL